LNSNKLPLCPEAIKKAEHATLNYFAAKEFIADAADCQAASAARAVP